MSLTFVQLSGKETDCYFMWFALSGRFMGESCRVKYLFTFELSANTKQRFMSGRVLVSLIQNSATEYIFFPTQTILTAHGTNASHTTDKQTNKQCRERVPRKQDKNVDSEIFGYI